MDGDLQASVRLLFHILSKRAEKVKEADLEQLVLWARSKGKLQKPSLNFCKVESQELGQLLWDAVIEGGDGREAVLAPRPPAAAAAAASNPARHVNCSRNKRSQSKIQRQEKVTESPSLSLVERVGRTKATDCGGEQQGAAVSTGQPPGWTAERQAGAGPGRAGPASTEPEAAPGRSGLRPRDRRLLVAEQQREEGDGRSRGPTHSDAARTGARRRRLPAAPSNGGGDAAQPGCHGNNNAKSSSATDGEMATLQQNFQQHFSNSLQETEDVMKKYSSTECFPRYQEGWKLCKSKLFQIQCG